MPSDELSNRKYRAKIESYYTGSNARRMWQGLKTIMDYKGKPRRELPSDASQPDKLNAFYARFEASNTAECMRAAAVFRTTVWPNMTTTLSLSLLTITVVGLITDNDETAYREEVRELAVWCQDNNLSVNVIKTKELIVD